MSLMDEFVLPDGFENFDTEEINEFECSDSDELVLIRIPKHMKADDFKNLKIDLKKSPNVNKDCKIVPAEGEMQGEMKNINLMLQKDGQTKNVELKMSYLVQPIINFDYEDSLLEAGNKAKNTPFEPRAQLTEMKIQSTPNGFSTGI